VDYIFDLNDDLLSKMVLVAKKVGKAIEKTIPCNRIGISVIGLEVPHAHIHLMPIQRLHDMSFEKERLSFTPEEYKEIARAIAANLQ
jgi:histidine triad (HIT) family protein